MACSSRVRPKLGNSHCLSLSSSDIHEQFVQPHCSCDKRFSSWCRHPWVWCLFLDLSCPSFLRHLPCWFGTSSLSQSDISSSTRDKQHPSRAHSDPSEMDLNKFACSILRHLEGTSGSQRVTIRRHTSIPFLTGLLCTISSASPSVNKTQDVVQVRPVCCVILRHRVLLDLKFLLTC